MKGKESSPKELIKNLKEETNFVEEETNKTLKKDKKHGQKQVEHHIQESEFKISSYFKFTKKNLTYKIVLAGIFLALSVAVSALDILLESVRIPIGDQVSISFRFLDTIVLLLGLPVLGPIFASLIGFVEPIFHNLIHGMEHGWIQPFTDAILNSIIIFISWLIFYIAFRNSPYHKDPNKKKDWFKRLTPAGILVVITALLATLSFVLALYIQDKVSGTKLLPDHDDIDWNDFLNSSFAKMFFAIFGVNILKYFIAFGCFVVFEGKMRAINHRYR